MLMRGLQRGAGRTGEEGYESGPEGEGDDGVSDRHREEGAEGVPLEARRAALIRIMSERFLRGEDGEQFGEEEDDARDAELDAHELYFEGVASDDGAAGEGVTAAEQVEPSALDSSQ